MITVGISKALADLRAAGCDADADHIESALTAQASAVLRYVRWHPTHGYRWEDAHDEPYEGVCGWASVPVYAHAPPAVPVASVPEGLTGKQAWWAGVRAGLGVPADMPRKRVADLLGKRVVIDVYQQDWMPGFAAFLDDGSLAESGRPKFAINLGAFIASISTGDIEKSEIPYFVAETLMHEIIHVIEKWAGVEFSEERVDALIEKYTLASRPPTNQERIAPQPTPS